MQRLILIRHAKAERDPPKGGGDFERPLTDRGRHEATRAGVRLAEAGCTPDLALVSAADRTKETWEYAAKAWGAVETRLTRDLYDADADSILEQARQVSDAETVAVVVHNPGAQLLAIRLLRQAGAAEEAARAERKFPTASAVVVDFAEGGASLVGVFYPREDPAEQ